jgi:hydroxymethylbilane synthase
LTLRIRIGTRNSPLALWQARRIQELLEGAGHEVELVEVQTTGDVIQDVPLSKIGSVAIFTRQLDEALLAGRIDIAVHSLKDLPTSLPKGIVLAAVSEREDPRDALVGRGLLRWAELPDKAVIATSSQRRRAQLLHARPDLRVVEVRGNIDTRLAKLETTPEWSATLLAAAGLIRLGLESRIGERLPLDLMLPAPGQGALAATARVDNPQIINVTSAALHHQPTELCVAAERALLRRLEGGCQVPVAAYAELRDGRELRLRGRVTSLDGTEVAEGGLTRRITSLEAAEEAGVSLADHLLARGAADILAAVRASSGDPGS